MQRLPFRGFVFRNAVTVFSAMPKGRTVELPGSACIHEYQSNCSSDGGVGSYPWSEQVLAMIQTDGFGNRSVNDDQDRRSVCTCRGAMQAKSRIADGG